MEKAQKMIPPGSNTHHRFTGQRRTHKSTGPWVKAAVKTGPELISPSFKTTLKDTNESPFWPVCCLVGFV